MVTASFFVSKTFFPVASKEEIIVQKEGNRNVRRKVMFYNLDAIIAVGYRGNSKKATQFKIWTINSYLK